MNKQTKSLFIIFVMILSLFLIGCSKSEVDEQTVSAPRAYMTKSLAMPAAEYASGGADYSPESANYAYDTDAARDDGSSTETKIIKNAYLNIEVEDFSVASQKAESLAKKYNGYLSNSQAQTDKNDKHSGTLTIRVADDFYDAIIAELSTLGEVKSKNQNSDDVTEEFIDLEARLNNSRAHEKRLLEMFEDAKNVNEMLQVERELSRVRESIETMQGKLNYLKNRVSMSTITVYLYEEMPVVQEWGIWQSIKDSLNNMLGTFRWLIELIGFLLPLTIFGGAIWMLIRWVRRRKKKQ